MAPKKWTPELTKFLINLYESHPVLYQINSPHYHNKIMRINAINTIRKELELVYKELFTADEITKKINNLRTQFMETMRNKKKFSLSESEVEFTKPSWWLYDNLIFLLPYVKKDGSESNLRLSRNTSKVENNENDTQEETNTNPIIETEETTCNEVKRQKLTIRDVSQVNEAYASRKESASKRTGQRDEYDLYGEQIAMKLRKMDEFTRTETQYRLNCVIYEAEIKVLEQHKSQL